MTTLSRRLMGTKKGGGGGGPATKTVSATVSAINFVRKTTSATVSSNTLAAVFNPQPLLADGINGGSFSTYNTGDGGETSGLFTPATNKLVLAFIYGQVTSGAPTLSSVTGNNTTWTIHDSGNKDTTHQKGTWLAWGYPASPTNGKLAVAFGGTMQDCGVIIWNVDNGASTNPIAQRQNAQRKDGNVATTAPTFGWPALDSTLNMEFLLVARFYNGSSPSTVNTYPGGWTQLSYDHPAVSSALMTVAYKTGVSDLQPSVTFNTGSDYYSSFLEVRAV